LAWGARVSAPFRDKVKDIALNLSMPKEGPSWLMACMAFETGETFRPDVRNAAGSGAVGLIQFMPATAADLGTTVEVLATLSAEAQLDYVRRYFARYRARLRTLSDCYMAILWPAAIGMPEDAVLWSQRDRPTTYRQNSGLDLNRDALILKCEAAKKVYIALEKGLRPENTAPL